MSKRYTKAEVAKVGQNAYCEGAISIMLYIIKLVLRQHNTSEDLWIILGKDESMLTNEPMVISFILKLYGLCAYTRQIHFKCMTYQVIINITPEDRIL